MKLKYKLNNDNVNESWLLTTANKKYYTKQ